MLNSLKVNLLEHIGGYFIRNGQTFWALGNRLLDMNPRGEKPSLWLEILESLGCLNGRPRINLAIAKSVAILFPNSGILPTSCFEIDRKCGLQN